MLCPEGSFLVPEIGILFGDAVGASLVMQHKVPLEGLICAQDNGTLQATKSCLKRLHVRVEALANVMEQTMITQQIQFMQDMAQHRQKSNDTDQIKSEPGDAPEVTSCQHNEWDRPTNDK